MSFHLSVHSPDDDILSKLDFVNFCPLDKDEMLWEFSNFILGISKTKDKYVLNYYETDFDKTNYVEVDFSYNLEDYTDEFIDWMLGSNYAQVL